MKRNFALFLIATVLLITAHDAPAPILEESPTPAATARPTSRPKAKPNPIPIRTEIAGIWTGQQKVAGIDYNFTLSVDPEATSVAVVRKRADGVTARFSCPTTVTGNRLSWQPGLFSHGKQVGTASWTLTPNSDGRTAQVKVTTSDGVSNTATFRKATQ